MAPSERDAADLALLIAAVRAAAPAALDAFRPGGEARAQTWTKADDSVVTAADLAVNGALREIIAEVRPGYGWLSEEDADDPARLQAERVAIVDPIDGTRSFVEGRPHWCVSVAIAEAGALVAAAVFAPALDKLFAAARGGPATLNGAPVRASDRPSLDGARVLGARNLTRPARWREPAPAFQTQYVQPIAYRLCLIAEGAYDAVLTLRDANEWDIAGGALIAAAAGARVTTPTGAPLVFNADPPQSPGLLAAGPALHGDMIARLAPGAAP